MSSKAKSISWESPFNHNISHLYFAQFSYDFKQLKHFSHKAWSAFTAPREDCFTSYIQFKITIFFLVVSNRQRFRTGTVVIPVKNTYIYCSYRIQQQHQRRGGKFFLGPTIFCSHKYHKNNNNFIFEQVKRFVVKTLGIIVLFTQKYEFGIQDWRSGIRKKRISDPGSRVKKTPDPGSGSTTLDSELAQL